LLGEIEHMPEDAARTMLAAGQQLSRKEHTNG
jgi:hypothetical protein